jgi:hypothetical protein
MAQEAANADRGGILKNGVFWMVLVALAVLWGSSGFPPIGFPPGEYVCQSRSGVQQYPISVYPGTPMKVIEYRPGQAADLSARMSYSHATFSSSLNLYLDGETYYCEHRG